MGDLYFIEQPGKLVYTYSRRTDGTWRMSRIAPCQNKKLVWVLHYTQDKENMTWLVQDHSPGSKNEVLGRPIVAVDSQQDPENPPLGGWRFGGYRCEVTDRMPLHPSLNPFPKIDVPFATMIYSEKGNIARLDTKVNNTVITDEALEDFLRQLANVVRNLATRPAMILLLHSDGQDATMPSFSQIRRFLAWIQENGPELFLVGRGSAIVLKPRGFIGMALVNVVRMVQRLLPPPWPEAIVNTSEEAEAFLAEHSRQYREDMCGSLAFNQKLVNGDISEVEVNSKIDSTESSGLGSGFLKAKLESLIPQKDRSYSEPAPNKNHEPEALKKRSLSAPEASKTSSMSASEILHTQTLWSDIPEEGRTKPVRSMALWPRKTATDLQDGTPRDWQQCGMSKA